MDALRLAINMPVIWNGAATVPAAAVRSGVDEANRRFGSSNKALVAAFTGRDLPGLVSYLAALEQGHAVALKEHPDKITREALLNTYEPEYVVDSGVDPVPDSYRVDGSFLGARLLVRSSPVSSTIHPELGLLVTTSGSSGRPKAVRLAYDNISANAYSIVQALGLDRTDVGITSLPIDYSFGLSIVNTHLLIGASLVLSAASPTSRRFWQLFDCAGVTNFGAVPQSYRLLHRMKWRSEPHSSLRLAYQAGGALEPSLIEHFGRAMAQTHGGFCPMYGATEATARMTCLAPDQLFDHLGSVGQPVPGGRLRRPEDGSGVEEIVYQGPNVMMGYAWSRTDLSSGDTTGNTLHTGDLGYLNRGMLYVVGRKDRQVKLHGKRVVLDDIERHLAPVGPVAAVPADGDTAVVFVEGSSEPFQDAWLDTLRAFELPGECLPLRSVDSLPRTTSGKVDLDSLQSMTRRERLR